MSERDDEVRDAAEAASAPPAPHLFDQTNGILAAYEDQGSDAADDGNDLDAPLDRFTGLGGNVGGF